MSVLLTFCYLVHIAKASLCLNKSMFVAEETFSDRNISTYVIVVLSDVAKKTVCALECEGRGECISFFYNSEKKQCQLHSKLFDSTNGSQISPGNSYYIIKLRFRSCADVKQCNSSYTDGEYWIYPLAFGHQAVKIYCHNMDGNPTEFVSLTVNNTAYYPNLNNQYCEEELPGPVNSNSLPGQTVYMKIRVNVETMEVIRNDSTFGQTTFGEIKLYGQAADCYARVTETLKCGPKGTFNIDLTGTGLRVDPQVVFIVEGYMYSAKIKRSANDTKIDLLCGGFPGFCFPEDQLLLNIFKPQEPALNSATVPVCEDP